MKNYWKWIISIVLVTIVIVGGGIFYRRDSHGKFFKASVSHEKVTMTPDWYAKVRLCANKGATYEVQNDKGKVVQGKTDTKNGKADIKLDDTGRYTIIAKSDNGHVSKKLPVKVTNYKANINKWTNSVGPLSFRIGRVEYKKVTKSSKNDTGFTDEIFDQLNKHYYQVQVEYEVRNNGKTPVSPQYTTWLPVDDNNREFPWTSGSADAVQNDNITGTSAIQPHGGRAGKLTMVSNRKFTVKHFHFDIEEVLGNEGKNISKGGTAIIK